MAVSSRLAPTAALPAGRTGSANPGAAGVKVAVQGARPTGRAEISVCPELYVFFDKKTGVRRFEVPADEDGGIPRERAASLLAIHCVARHQSPAEFGVMVAPAGDLIREVAKRSQELIRSCSLCEAPRVLLSRRQNEVLSAIARNLTNKEIAHTLHLSERTVKFHVSALLQRFKVRKRSDLMLEAFDVLGPGCSPYPPSSAPASRAPSDQPPSLQALRPIFIEHRSAR
jgi:DNA-binding CsgD family transcriptional regulator